MVTATSSDTTRPPPSSVRLQLMPKSWRFSFVVAAVPVRAARDAVAELTARMKKPDNADDAELQAFLTEAQELVEGTGGGRKPAPGGAGRD